MPKPPLMDRLAAVPLERGRVTVCEVRHDAWCRLYTTGLEQDCNCDPDIVVTQIPRPSRPEG